MLLIKPYYLFEVREAFDMLGVWFQFVNFRQLRVGGGGAFRQWGVSLNSRLESYNEETKKKVPREVGGSDAGARAVGGGRVLGVGCRVWGAGCRV
jgi:hypothetical protein